MGISSHTVRHRSRAAACPGPDRTGPPRRRRPLRRSRARARWRRTGSRWRSQRIAAEAERPGYGHRPPVLITTRVTKMINTGTESFRPSRRLLCAVASGGGDPVGQQRCRHDIAGVAADPGVVDFGRPAERGDRDRGVCADRGLVADPMQDHAAGDDHPDNTARSLCLASG